MTRPAPRRTCRRLIMAESSRTAFGSTRKNAHQAIRRRPTSARLWTARSIMFAVSGGVKERGSYLRHPMWARTSNNRQPRCMSCLGVGVNQSLASVWQGICVRHQPLRPTEVITEPNEAWKRRGRAHHLCPQTLRRIILILAGVKRGPLWFHLMLKEYAPVPRSTREKHLSVFT
jgi:hypothetical protein